MANERKNTARKVRKDRAGDTASTVRPREETTSNRIRTETESAVPKTKVRKKVRTKTRVAREGTETTGDAIERRMDAPSQRSEAARSRRSAGQRPRVRDDETAGSRRSGAVATEKAGDRPQTTARKKKKKKVRSSAAARATTSEPTERADRSPRPFPEESRSSTRDRDSTTRSRRTEDAPGDDRGREPKPKRKKKKRAAAGEAGAATAEPAAPEPRPSRRRRARGTSSPKKAAETKSAPEVATASEAARASSATAGKTKPRGSTKARTRRGPQKSEATQAVETKRTKLRSSRKSGRRPSPARLRVETGDRKEVAKRKYAPGEGKADRRILISTRDDQESRVCVVAENRLEELYVDKVGDNSYLGNIYLGKVVNLEPSIGAAFVDFGEGKNGFLHASDVIPTVHESRVKDFLALNDENHPPAEAARRTDERKNIDEMLKLGDELVVQVTKDGIGHKGPTLTTYISIPGCYLVLMPNLRRTGVSRKISDNEERRRLREILKGLKLPESLGFIIRTAGEDHPRQDLERDAQFLMKMWSLICRRLKGARAAASLYRETDLILRSLRDLFTPDTVDVVVDEEKHYRRCLDFMRNVMTQYADRVKLYDKPKPLFTEYDLDTEVEKVFQRKIQLASGGSIVFDQAEALVAIDVNSGKNKEESDLEETALKTNLEAIPEIVRQLRLRDLGGLVIIDFIDVIEERHRRRVERALLDELRKDRARFRMEGMSMFGIVELTRQRVRPSLFVAASATCPACGGQGTVKSADSVSHTILRRIRGEMGRQNCAELEVRLHPIMASYFLNTRRAVLLEMEETFEKGIRVTPDPLLRYEELRLAYHDRASDLAGELEHYL